MIHGLAPFFYGCMAGSAVGAVTVRSVMDIRSQSGLPYRLVQLMGRELKKMDERIVAVAAGIRALPAAIVADYVAKNPPVAADTAPLLAKIDDLTAQLAAKDEAHEAEIAELQAALADATPKPPAGGDDDPGQKTDAVAEPEALGESEAAAGKPALFGGLAQGPAEQAA